MPRIAIITDTDSSLPPALAAQQHIKLVPIRIQFGGDSYDTGVDIDDARLFARVNAENKLPTTAAPAPGLFASAYQEAFDAGYDEIICITISSEVSAVCSAALMAANEFPGRAIHVVDSRTLSMAEGFMVLRAAEMAQAGATSAEILPAIEAVRDHSRLFGALATVKYLAMSGRVGQVAAGLATILNIRPILTVREGKLELLERIRTQRLAWERLLTLVAEFSQGKPLTKVALLHVAAQADVERFALLFKQRFVCPSDLVVAELTPGLSVHTGAGMIAVVVVVGD